MTDKTVFGNSIQYWQYVLHISTSLIIHFNWTAVYECYRTLFLYLLLIDILTMVKVVKTWRLKQWEIFEPAHHLIWHSIVNSAIIRQKQFLFKLSNVKFNHWRFKKKKRQYNPSYSLVYHLSPLTNIAISYLILSNISSLTKKPNQSRKSNSNCCFEQIKMPRKRHSSILQQIGPYGSTFIRFSRKLYIFWVSITHK